MMRTGSITVILIVSLIPVASSIQCWQCAAAEGRRCPDQAVSTSSAGHDACITWRHGNGSILLQNVVMSVSECSEERIQFWSRFVNLYYQTYGGSVSCCFTDNCNDGTRFNAYPVQISQSLSNNYPSSISSYPTRISPAASFSQSAVSTFPHQSFSASQNLNNAPNYVQQFTRRNGNCEHYFDKIESDEWIPDTLIPLAFDRASKSRVGVFYTKFEDDSNRNRRNNLKSVVIRILDKSKRNDSMYSIRLGDGGQVTMAVSQLQAGRGQNTDSLTEQERTLATYSTEISFEKSQLQGFWIAVRNGIDISIGRIGDKIINPLANYSDIIREGPDDPYYFGLTVSDTASAQFGVNCDMPGLHFDDTCVTDEDCAEFPNTVCAAEPINTGLDSGTRRLPFDQWREGDTLLRSCWCRAGHLRIPQSAGCYDPIRRVVTIQDGCFADYHCNDLPNTYCTEDLLLPRYNKSCQCLPGNKPFLPDPRTGLVEGCAPLTDKDLATVQGCSRKFNIKNRGEWVPETYYPVTQEATSFFVKFAPEGDIESTDDDTAVIRLLDGDRSRNKMYTIKISKEGGRMSLYHSQITSGFFLLGNSQTEREVDTATDPRTTRMMQEDFVGFWVKYKYEAGYGGQISFGLANTPASSDYALLRWTDTSTEALRAVSYIGFTNGARAQSIDYGAVCVMFDFTNVRRNGGLLSQPQLPYPQYAQYPQAYSGQGYPGGRSDFENIVQELMNVDKSAESSTTTTTTNPVIPWDIFSLLSVPTPRSKNKKVYVQDQKVLEPVLKNQYLTKLQRGLLPPPSDVVSNFDAIVENIVE